MITSVNLVRAGQAAQGETRLRDLIADVAGTDDLDLARIVEQTAYGVLRLGRGRGDRPPSRPRPTCGAPAVCSSADSPQNSSGSSPSGAPGPE